MTLHPLERRQDGVPTQVKGVGRNVFDEVRQSDRLASVMPSVRAETQQSYNIKNCRRAYKRLAKALDKSIVVQGTSRGNPFTGMFIVRGADRYQLLHDGDVDERVKYSVGAVVSQPRRPARVCISDAFPVSVHSHAVHRFAQRELIDDVDAIIAELDLMAIMAAAMLPSRISVENCVAEPSLAVPSTQGGVWVGFARVNLGVEGIEPTFDVRTYLDAGLLNDDQLGALADLKVADPHIAALGYARMILLKWKIGRFYEPEPKFDTSLCNLFDPVSGDNAARRAKRQVLAPYERVTRNAPLPAEFLREWDRAVDFDLPSENLNKFDLDRTLSFAGFDNCSVRIPSTARLQTGRDGHP